MQTLDRQLDGLSSTASSSTTASLDSCLGEIEDLLTYCDDILSTGASAAGNLSSAQHMPASCCNTHACCPKKESRSGMRLVMGRPKRSCWLIQELWKCSPNRSGMPLHLPSRRPINLFYLSDPGVSVGEPNLVGLLQQRLWDKFVDPVLLQPLQTLQKLDGLPLQGPTPLSDASTCAGCTPVHAHLVAFARHAQCLLAPSLIPVWTQDQL